MERRNINRVTTLLLALGLGAGLLVFVTAQPVELDPLLGDPLQNKKFVHELRVIGGKSNVMAAEFMDWFGSLWHGPRLGETIACLTVAGALAFRFVAARPDIWRGSSSSSADRDDRNS